MRHTGWQRGLIPQVAWQGIGTETTRLQSSTGLQHMCPVFFRLLGERSPGKTKHTLFN